MTDLNTAIALSKGYKFGQPVSGMNRDIWYETFPDSGWFETKCPDHEHDANLYMGLFEEIGKTHNVAKIEIVYGYIDIHLCIYYTDRPEDECDSFDANYLGTAICQAYVKLKGIEVVG